MSYLPSYGAFNTLPLPGISPELQAKRSLDRFLLNGETGSSYLPAFGQPQMAPQPGSAYCPPVHVRAGVGLNANTYFTPIAVRPNHFDVTLPARSAVSYTLQNQTTAPEPHYYQAEDKIPKTGAESKDPSDKLTPSKKSKQYRSKNKDLPLEERRKYICKTCARGFTTSGHLARHNRIHTGEKRHKCQYPGCLQRFSRHDNCIQHYRTHFKNPTTKAAI